MQCQEQYKIPDVNLIALVHPDIKTAAEKVRMRCVSQKIQLNNES
jgi:hypothetical protein